MNDKITPDQIENYRRVLVAQLGPYALLMPVSQIEAYWQRMQCLVTREEEI